MLVYLRDGSAQTSSYVVWFLIHMSIIWIYVVSRICPVGRPAVLRDKNFNVGHCMQTVQPIFFMPPMLIGTIDFYHLYYFH